jgi:flagellar protein FlhE
MNSLFYRLTAILAFASMLMLSQAANAGGAYSSFAVGQTILTKNTAYYDYFPVIGSPPSTGPLTSVSWSYGFSSRPAGLLVYLCQTGIGCLDVTSYGSGTTTAFNTAGGHPNGQFFLYYGVNGSGGMSPVYSNNNNVIVNW